MDAQKLNQATGVLPIKSIKSLKIGEIYRLTDLKGVNTKYGPKMIVEIDSEYVVFLPQRMVKIFNADQTNLFEKLKKDTRVVSNSNFPKKSTMLLNFYHRQKTNNMTYLQRNQLVLSTAYNLNTSYTK